MPAPARLRRLLLALLVHSVRCARCSPASPGEVLQGIDLTGQTHLITGGNSGIAYGAVKALATAHARIIMLVHSKIKGEAAARAISEETGNPNITIVPIELTDFQSVRSAVQQLHDMGIGRANSLTMNSARVAPPASPFTPDGFNSLIGTNVLGHFLLAHLLLPILRAAQPPGRVLWLASLFKRDGGCGDIGLPASCTQLSELESTIRKPSGIHVPVPGVKMDTFYYISKWLMSVLALASAKKEASHGGGVSHYSLIPGMIWTPGSEAAGSDLIMNRKVCRCKGIGDPRNPTRGCPGTCLLDTESGATAIVHLITKNIRASNGARFSHAEKCPGRVGIEVPGGMLPPTITPMSPAYLEGLIQLFGRLTLNTSGGGGGSSSGGGVGSSGAGSSGSAQPDATKVPRDDDFVDAGMAGNLEGVLSALADGQNVDYQKPPKNDTALMLAAYYGHIEVVKHLLAAGANVRLRDVHNVDAASHAADQKRKNIVAIFRAHRATQKRSGIENP